MKRIAILLLLLTTLASAQTTVFLPPYGQGLQKPLWGARLDYSNPLTKDLLALYPMRYTGNDDIGYSSDAHGTWDAVSTSDPDYTTTNVGTGLTFNGSTNSIGVSYVNRVVLLIPNYPCTISVKGVHTAGAAGNTFVLCKGTATGDWIGVNFAATNVVQGMHSRSSNYSLSGLTTIATNEMAHGMYICYHTTDRRVYLNGRLDLQSAVSGPFPAQQNLNARFGLLNRSVSDVYYSGTTVHGALWTRALTSSEARTYSDNVNGMFIADDQMGTSTAAAAAQMYMVTKR